MTITPTTAGLDHLMVSAFLEGVKRGYINCQYSGTMRWRDANLPRDFLLECINAWLILVTNPAYTADYLIDPEIGDTDDAEVLTWLINNGSVVLDERNSAFINLSSGLKRLGYDFTSQSNIPDGGIIMYGKDGIGTIMAQSDDSMNTIIEGTQDAFNAQFPNRRVQGNDVTLLLAASTTLMTRIVFGTPSPYFRFMDYMIAFRAVLPPVVTP